MDKQDTNLILTAAGVAVAAAVLYFALRPRRPIEIDVDNLDALKYWCGKLGITEDQIRQAVHVVGPFVNNIARHLGIQLTGEGAEELRQ